MRTVAVFLGGLIISFATQAVLTNYVVPDHNQLMIRLFTTPPESKEWPEIARQWHHLNTISVFLLAPVAAFASGIFVGLLQRQHGVLVAALSQVPEGFFLVWSDRLRPWGKSLSGVASFLAQHSLPIIAAALGVLICRWVLTAMRSPSVASTAHL